MHGGVSGTTVQTKDPPFVSPPTVAVGVTRIPMIFAGSDWNAAIMFSMSRGASLEALEKYAVRMICVGSGMASPSVPLASDKKVLCSTCTAADVAAYGGIARAPVMEVTYTWRRRGARRFSPEPQVMRLCYGCAMQYGVIDILPGQILKLGSGDMCVTKMVRSPSAQPQPAAQPTAQLAQATAPPYTNGGAVEEMMDELYGRW